MPTIPTPFYQNEILFGHNPIQGIVAVEFDGDRNMEVFFREEGKLRREKQTFRPFLLLADLSLLDGYKGKVETTPLSGNRDLQNLLYASDWKELNGLVKHLSKKSGKTAGDPTAPYFFPADPVHQHLLITGQTHFKGMLFDDLVRMQIDLETAVSEGFEFPNPEREGDRIIAIGITDNKGLEKVLSMGNLSEAEMLQTLIEIVQEQDPDVIEGHNLFNFDLVYLAARAKRHGIPLMLGRDGREARAYPSRIQIAERSISYTRFNLYGRHVVDTLFLTQMYDVSTRELESYGLKEVARHFKLTRPDRVLIEPGRINWYAEHAPDQLLAYCLDDVRETRALSGLLSPSFFYQSQIFPYSYQNVILRGNATKIDSLFVREYLHQGHAIPLPPPSREFAGGYTDLFYQGVVFHVVNCDVQSLYPSLMLTFGFTPQNDLLKIFPKLLGDLRSFRLRAKELIHTAQNDQEAYLLDALQSTFKILINSFYGYLGFPLGHFADFNQAEQVTSRGRELIRNMVQWLSNQGCRVIEIDTDGIYFVPPQDAQNPKAEGALVEALSETLPEGIHLELSGRYQAMFSYKMKNYVLLDENGKMIIKGSGLKSRGLERFQRRFMEELFKLLLTERAKEAPLLLERYRKELLEHRWDLKMLMKTETLQESLPVYQEKVRNKKRNVAASYELALKSGRPYQAGDSISFYVTGTKKKVKVAEACKLASQWDPNHPDENTAYYEQKLLDLYEKFQPFLANPSVDAPPSGS